MTIYSTLKGSVCSAARRIRSCFRGKKGQSAKAAERETEVPDTCFEQDHLSVCSDSSSIWNVTPISYRDVFDLSMESDQDAWTVDTVALDAILSDIAGEEEDPYCPPRLRFRRCTSSELRSKGLTSAASRSARSLPPIIQVREADVACRWDTTIESETRPNHPPARPKHSIRRQGGPLRPVKLPPITDCHSLQWSVDFQSHHSMDTNSWSTCSVLIAYQTEDRE